jgi:RNA polymerase sigma factor (sigma-70 family)
MNESLTKPKSRPGGNTLVYDAFIKYQAPLKRFISRFLRCPYDIEDVAQEAFLRAYSTEKGRQIEQPKSFLFRIAKHIALTQLTQKSRQITDYIEDFDESEVFPGGDSTEDEVIARQTLGIHCEAIAELPPQCRRAYIMRKVYGMSHKEIAGRLAISVSTVEKHLIKGVKQCDHYVRLRTEKNNRPIQKSSRVKS